LNVLWAGVPLITLPWETFAGRMSTSAVVALDLTSEMIALTLQEYETLAVDYATNPTKLQQVRKKLWENRLTKPLYDCQAWVTAYERNLWTAYRRAMEGKQKDHIKLNNR
jgi:predicted O-linked N-acetylglucosamine transferase (SPINDLY family)